MDRVRDLSLRKHRERLQGKGKQDKQVLFGRRDRDAQGLFSKKDMRKALKFRRKKK
jgi:hypothetical protein